MAGEAGSPAKATDSDSEPVARGRYFFMRFPVKTRALAMG